MKKIFRFSVVAAAAVLALVSCQRSELSQIFSGPKTKVTIGVKPEDAEEATRTYIEEDATTPGTYHSKWSNSGEALGLLFGDIAEGLKPVILEAASTTDNDPIFTGDISIDDGATSLFIFYPGSAYKNCYKDGTVGLEVKDVQHPELGTFDPACDIMGWYLSQVTVENGSLVLENVPLSRVMAIVRLVLNAGDAADGMTVTGVRMEVAAGASASEAVALTGIAALTTAGNISKWNSPHSYVEAEIDESECITAGEDEFNEVFLIVNPATIPSGRKITFTVDGKNVAGDEIQFRREVSKDVDITFQAGKINTISLKLRDKDLVQESGEYYEKVKSADDLVAGEYLIVYEGNETHGAIAFNGGLTALDATNNGIAVEISEEKIAANTTLDGAVFTIDPDAGTIFSKSEKYIYFDSFANGLKVSDEAPENINTFNIDESGNAVIGIAFGEDANPNTITLRYNYNTDQARFRYYKSGQQPVALYASPNNVVDPTPRVTFPETEKTVEASATSVEFAYSANKYVTSVPSVNVQDEQEIISGQVTVGDGKITVPLNPNTDEQAKTAILIVTGQGIDDAGVQLVITQQAYEAPAALTIASLNSQIRTDSITDKNNAVEYSGVIQDVIVTEIAGGYVFAEDATGGILLYQVSGIEEGMKMSGQATFKGFMYNNMPEVIAFTAPATVETGATIPSTTYTSIADLITDWDAKMSMRILLKNVEVTQAFSSWNAKVKDSAGNELIVRDYNKSGLSLSVGNIVNLTGYPAQYNNDKQFAVLKSSDIELSPDAASIAVNPSSLNWAAGEYGNSNAKNAVVSINAGGAFTVSGSSADWTVQVNGNEVTAYPNAANGSTSDDKTLTLTFVHNSSSSVTATLVLTQSKLISTVGDGTQQNPYTAGDILSVYATAGSGDNSVYVRGTVTSIKEVSTQYGNATYTISDGTNSVTVFRGKYLNNASFTSADQIEVGDIAVVYGKIALYNNVPQLAQNNYLISLEKDASTPTLSVSPESLSWGATEYGLDNAKQIAVTLNGNAAPDDYYIEYTASSDWTISDDENRTITVYPNAANAGTSAKTFTFVVKHSDDESIAKTVTCTQAAPGGGTPTEESITSGTFTSANSKLTLTLDSGVTIEQSRVSGTTAVNATYNTVSTLRVYKGHALTFSGKTFTKIEITVTGTYYGNSLTASSGTITPTSTSGGTIVWEGESDNVVITNTATASNVQLRTNSFKVTY